MSADLDRHHIREIEAENRRLREALEEFVAIEDGMDEMTFEEYGDRSADLLKKARTALQGAQS